MPPMLRSPVTPLLLVALLGSGPALAADPIVVTLDELLRRARGDNPVVRIAQADLAKRVATFDRAYYAWTPTLKIESVLAPLPERRLLRECVVDGVVEPCPGQDLATDERITPDTEIGILTRTTARLTFPIYTFGKIEAAQRAARANVEVGQGSVAYARGELELLVKKAYYGAQLAASALDILGDGRKRMRKAKRRVQKDLDAETGRFTSQDLAKLEVEGLELEAGHDETRALERYALLAIQLAGGIRRGERFALDTDDLRAVHIEPRTAEGYVELALVGRPDLRMAEAAVRARRGQVQMAQADFYPDIALIGAFGFAKGTTADDSPDPFAKDEYNFLYWGVVLGASWKIDFARLFSELNHAEATLSKQRAERDALAMKIELDVSEAAYQMQRHQRALVTRKKAMKLRKSMLVRNTLNFGIGTADTDDLVKTLVAWSKARLKYFETIYKYNLAVAQLSRAVGAELAVPAPLEVE